jgi:hypothetical protein
VTFWYGSGSADPYHWLTGPDPDSDLAPDPAFFVSGWQDANKKFKVLKKFFRLILFEGTFTSVFKNKRQKEVKKYEKFRIFLIVVRRIQTPIRMAPKTYGSRSTTLIMARQTLAPTDPDPQNW